MASNNRRVILKERPRYIIPTAKCFSVENTAAPEPADGEVVVKTLWLGMEPYLLGRVKNWAAGEQLRLGEAMVGPGVGRVESSRHSSFRSGDLVYGLWAWQEHAVTSTERLRKLPEGLPKLSHRLGVLGYSGFGAYIAINDVGAAKAGETVVIGTATGGFGQVAGQLAKLKGCRVVGIAGGPEKCKLAVEQLGYDACVDHEARDFNQQLQRACPKGIDLYLETIGGVALNGAIPLFNAHGRMIVCGLMELYSAGNLPDGPDRTMLLLNQAILKRLSITGLSLFDHLETRYDAFEREMIGLLQSGKLKPLEYTVEGLDKAPGALQDMFEGRNLGKTVVHVAD